ncbi:Peptide hydrolase [Abortiporus biennis]
MPTMGWKQWRLLDLATPILLVTIFLTWPSPSLQASSLDRRELKQLSSQAIASLVSHPDPVKNIDPANPSSHLSKILIPRPPDTQNNTIVRQYIVSTLQKLKWHVEEDSFSDTTPYGVKKFTNIIATKDPKAPKRVILSAHFDSKYFASSPQNQFVGATDSAAPCAFLLDLAEALNPLLDARQQRLEDGEEDDMDVAETTLQLVFFDGEEAFKDWTATDSIYGAKHLASKWQSTPVQNSKSFVPSPLTEIDMIEHFILFDLLGSKNPVIRSSYINTAWLFDAMASAEHRLAQSGHFVYKDPKVDTADNWSSFFLPRDKIKINFGGIEDDHIPFVKLGVDILHVISNPFPSVWHTLKDDASALDIPTMRRWNLILRVFTCEYLNLVPTTSHARRIDDELL